MESFSNQVDALTGFSTTDNDALSDWLTFGAREIINMMPNKMKQKCSKLFVLNGTNGTTLDLDDKGKVLHVTRKYASDKHHVPCREVSPLLADSANDSTSIHKASKTDPVYYITSNSSSEPRLFVLPTPTNDEPSNAYCVNYPTITHTDGASGIANFPDELEYLVVLYAAIKALEAQAILEEDPELYLPLIQNLKQDYTQGLQLSGVIASQGAK